MRLDTFTATVAALAAGASAKPTPRPPIKRIDLGPRPGFLVDDMDEGKLKDELSRCLASAKPIRASTWSIGHRGGGTLFIPEHSLESNMAGARMGAGILECDVAFTRDRELVCRHSQCDLHYTTDILARPELAAKCSEPFTPAADGVEASAKCCTSDITLAEFKTLCATMEGFNPGALTPEDFHPSTADWRTDLYATCGQVLSLKEHIDLTVSLGLLHTPELKTPEVEMPFEGDYTQEQYAQQLVDTYKERRVPAKDVWLQSFLYDDILYWLKKEPKFGAQATYLDETGDTPETFPGAVANLTRYAEDGVKYIAPPLPYLVTVGKKGEIVPSEYAKKAKKLGLKIIAWTLERSGRLAEVQEDGNYYYATFADAIDNDGDVYNLLDVLWRKIGIVGLFSDWSATATFYANCMGIGLRR
ncbi:Glycerophosphoryl diester phosphodiesterase-like protein [Hapsidospora chrysogenum ATCC 11550]|uniref:glycerophosphodiester phosphodiesterase n=1 Tax=Hapsidospora chrysogenum (strain ATCC 11550 / CBS 779.69 / DSM 880 / IAM 14645 / JCM 23072 / IMI 49137) TaxID=857340 RepID=A0A086TD93_HAPC1|nr:Glycerophosphoryl diester phosphodiesterase-like protein [Hapsidospora chrysogenum ATCC 11550]